MQTQTADNIVQTLIEDMDNRLGFSQALDEASNTAVEDLRGCWAKLIIEGVKGGCSPEDINEPIQCPTSPLCVAPMPRAQPGQTDASLPPSAQPEAKTSHLGGDENAPGPPPRVAHEEVEWLLHRIAENVQNARLAYSRALVPTFGHSELPDARQQTERSMANILEFVVRIAAQFAKEQSPPLDDPKPEPGGALV